MILAMVLCLTSAVLSATVISGVLLSGSAHAAENSILGLRLGAVAAEGNAGQSEQTLRVVIETSNPVMPRVTLLQDPYRLVVDMP